MVYRVSLQKAEKPGGLVKLPNKPTVEWALSSNNEPPQDNTCCFVHIFPHQVSHFFFTTRPSINEFQHDSTNKKGKNHNWSPMSIPFQFPWTFHYSVTGAADKYERKGGQGETDITTDYENDGSYWQKEPSAFRLFFVPLLVWQIMKLNRSAAEAV